MSKVFEKLQKKLREKLNYPCEVWFDHRIGWMYKTDKTSPQNIGSNQEEAMNFIENSSTWSFIIKQLHNNLNV